MIWIGRLIALPLGLLFVALLPVVLVALRTTDTFFSHDFYIEQLREGDVYNFLYDEALPSAVEEQIAESAPPFDVALVSDEIQEAVRQALPPEWIQENVEQVIGQVFPYATGETDDFLIAMPLADRAKAGGETIKELLAQEDVHLFLYDELIPFGVEEAIQELSASFSLELSETERETAQEDLVAAIRRVAPPEWLQEQVGGAVDAVVPYLTSEADQFTLTISFTGRLEPAAEVLKDLLRSGDVTTFLFDEVIAPVVGEDVGLVAELPLDVVITQEEIVEAVRLVAPPIWIQQRLEAIIDAVVPYLTGQQDNFAIVVPLADRIPVAEEVLRDLANRKLEELFVALPPCTLAQALDLAKEGLGDGLPACRPLGFSLGEIKQELGITAPDATLEDIERLSGIPVGRIAYGLSFEELIETTGLDMAAEIKRAIGDKLPQQFRFTEADLLQNLSDEEQAQLDQIRETVRGGWRYTDRDLRSDLGEEAETTLDTILATVREGWTYTESDLREDLALLETNPPAQGFLDDFRGSFTLARQYQFLVYLVPTLLLLLIAVLGGRGWWGKLRWAAIFLGLAAGATYAAAGPLFRLLTEQNLDDLLEALRSGAEGTNLMIIDKGIALADNVVTAFLSGIETQALQLLMVALGAWLASIVGALVFRRRRRALEDTGRLERRE